MFSNTYLPVSRQPVTRAATGAIATLILAAFAQTTSASDANKGPGPHWSSRIGTGQSLVTGLERQQAHASDASTSPHWSSRIGTGGTVAGFVATPVASSTAGVPAPTHWSAQIGTGQAAPRVDARKLAQRKGPAEARVIAKPLGDHPAVLVAQSWSSRGIDANTFIVRHPAGPIWVSTSAAATENAAPKETVRAVRTASASSK